MRFFASVLLIGLVFAFSNSTFAQSTSAEFPTPVSTNEIKGTINARDLGDSRLTSYYYTFNGSQGDIFINIAAKNFNGDIDVYKAEGLQPISKITFYGDSGLIETGRVIYLRKPEKIILRVQGRTPDDNPATFQIKFAGSFVAVEDNGESKPLELPEIKTDDSNGIRVNSVGTIVETKPTPESKETVAENKVEEEKTPEEKNEVEIPKVVVTDELENKTEDETKKKAESVAETDENKDVETPVKPKTNRNPRRTTRRTTAAKKLPEKAEEKTTETIEESANKNPLENVRLRVLMKNGDKLEFPMTEVFRFSLNNGILTIITKDGKIHRHPIVDVQKMTVE